MSSFERKMLENRERKLDDCLFFIGELSSYLGFFWVVFCYHIFYFQQMKIPTSGSGKSELFLPSMLWVAYFLICSSPSKKKRGKEMTIADWNLIPNRIVGVVGFLIGSYLLLKYTPIAGRICEDAVLVVYWKTFVAGLWILMLSSIIAIRMVFHLKLYSTVAVERCGGKKSNVRRMTLLAIFITLILLFISFTSFEIDPLRFLNFIYN